MIEEDEEMEEIKVKVAPGETVGIWEIDGSKAITSLQIKMDLPTDPVAERKLLRELAISIYWDNEDEPSVWSPLGDFFGTAPGVNKYRSLMMGMTGEGFYSRWFMPFSDKVLLQLSNDGGEEQIIKFIITHKPLNEPIKKYGRFHAKWHRDALLIEDEDRWPDWPILKTKGRGRFCGIHLHIWNPVWVKFWEGAKPGDYCQTLNENNSNGNISLVRFQVADNVPYQKLFEGVFEKYYPNEWEGNATKYAVTVYFCQAVGEQNPYKAVPVEERIGYFN